VVVLIEGDYSCFILVLVVVVFWAWGSGLL
jgi:hypothetical protein